MQLIYKSIGFILVVLAILLIPTSHVLYYILGMNEMVDKGPVLYFISVLLLLALFGTTGLCLLLDIKP